MKNEIIKIFSGVVIEEEKAISLAELCQCCNLPTEQLIIMVEHGIIEPLETNIAISHWTFSGDSLVRVQTALRLQRDLDINLAGAVLAVELLDEIKELRQLVAFLKRE